MGKIVMRCMFGALMLVAGSANVGAQETVRILPTAQSPRLTGFSVALVEGDLKAATATEGLSGAAAKAIADLKDFLPYRSYRLLDTQWTRGSERMVGRLRDQSGREFQLDLMAEENARLQELVAKGLAAPRTAREGQLSILRFNLKEVGPSEPTFVGPAAAGTRTAHSGGSIIDTSFRMNIGETVVVGTSRQPGDKGLIVLLTAVGK